MKKNKSRNKFIKKLILLIILFILSLLATIPIFNNLNYGLDLQGGFEVLYEVNSVDGKVVTTDMVTNTYRTLIKRIDEFGVSEPVVTIEGEDKIRIQLAGIKNGDEARDSFSQVANLTFRDVDDNLLMTSDVLDAGGASVSTDEYGNPAISLEIKDLDKFYEVTKEISSHEDSSKRMLVIWLDFEEGVNSYATDYQTCGDLESSRCLSAAGVSQAFASDVIISGGFETEDATELVKLINSGSLPTKLEEISSKTVAASFGEDSLEKTIAAGIVGVILIMIFMIILYRFTGLVSCVSLMLYTTLTFSIFYVVGGTLTLPGIAALVIGMGMAVDANVISFARIKDELKNGQKLKSAFILGNKNAFTTILDSNLTTLIIAIILFIFGESSVKGFATMLMISIFVTMFIMVLINRVLIKKMVDTKFFDNKLNLFIGYKKTSKDKFAKLDFVKTRAIFYAISILIITIGAVSLFTNGLNLGIDFKGGTSINISSEQEITEKDLLNDFNELNVNVEEITYASNDNIVVTSTDKLSKEKISETEQHFTENYNAKTDIGVISNIVKNELINNAFTSVILASIAIVIYISFRFKFKYALSAIVALIHDALIIVLVFSVFNLEITSIFIAAILSIIGYSINDTIVTFDRVRENINKSNITTKDELSDTLNTSLKQIFRRSIITSVTTIIPVISLIVLGSYEIINFNIALLIGLLVGVYSSLFIASGVWFDLNKNKIENIYKKKWYEEEEE